MAVERSQVTSYCCFTSQSVWPLLLFHDFLFFFFCNSVVHQLFGQTLIYWMGACAVRDAHVPHHRLKTRTCQYVQSKVAKKQYFSNLKQRAFYMQPIKRRRQKQSYCINGTHMLRIREWVSKICCSHRGRPPLNQALISRPVEIPPVLWFTVNGLPWIDGNSCRVNASQWKLEFIHRGGLITSRDGFLETAVDSSLSCCFNINPSGFQNQNWDDKQGCWTTHSFTEVH